MSFRWLCNLVTPNRPSFKAGKPSSRWNRYRLDLEHLEHRLAPAVRTWTGLGDAVLWSDPNNWDSGVPVNGDEVVIPDVAATTKVLMDSTAADTSLISIISDEAVEISARTLTLNGTPGTFSFAGGLTIAGGTLVALDSASASTITLESGTIDIRGGATVSTTAGDYTQNGGATIIHASAILDPSGSMILNGGTLRGEGIIQGDVVNVAGTVQPGNTLGILTIQGNYEQQAAGAIEHQLGGTNLAGDPAPQHDQLNVTGTVSLSGRITVFLVNNPSTGKPYAAELGDRFRVLNFSSSTGNFTIKDFPDLSPAFRIARDFFSDHMDLVVAPFFVAPTDLNLDPSNVDENQPSGTVVGTFTTVDPDIDDSHTYSLVGGTGSEDNAAFVIDGNQLKTNASFDFESKSSYSIRVRTTDEGGLIFEKAFIITINDVNEPPTDIVLDPSNINENEAAGTVVGTLTSVDPDLGDSHSYALVAGDGDADNASFIIEGDQLKTAASFDFEAKNSYTIRVQSTDAGGLTFEKAIIISINNVNEPPTDILLDNSSVEENQSPGTMVGIFSTVDVDDGDTHTYSLVSGEGDDDNASFTIEGDQLRTAESFNFEGQNTFSIRVQTTDSGGLTLEKIFTVTVTNVNEPPTDIVLDNDDVAENEPAGTVVGNLLAFDEDAGESFTFALASGEGDADNASFVIDGNLLKTAESFDHEAKDAYSVRVQVTDSGGLTFEKVLTIHVTDVNEAPTDISLDNNSVDENQAVGTAVGVLSATDPDEGDTFTYSLVNGDGDEDNSAFVIDGDVLRTSESFNFEAKANYSIRVQAMDSGGLTVEKVFTITIQDVNDGPTDIELDNSTVDENLPSDSLVGTLTAVDEDGLDAFEFSLVPGVGDTDNGSFVIDGDQLLTAESFNFEGKDSYSIRIQVIDAGGLTFQKTFTITINDVNEAPTDIDLSNTIVGEAQPIGTVVGTFSTVDEDGGESFTYTLVDGAGADDNGSFVIDGDQLKTNEVFDIAVKDSYSIRVQVMDKGGLTFEKTFVISVTDVNQPPTDIELDNTVIEENQPAGTLVGTFSTSDPDVGDTFTYALVAGVGSTDNASFTIVGDQLMTAASLDFEVKDSFSIRVQTMDSAGNTFEKVFIITVGDVQESPTDIELDNTSIAENQPAGTTVGTFSTVDPDDTSGFVYALVAGEGSADNIHFTISGDQLQTAAPFDFETKNSFSIRVRTTDPDGNTFEKSFIINITNLNEAPTGLALSSSSIAENQPAGSVVGTFSTVDPDAGDSFTYELVTGPGSTDNASFTINGDQLQTVGSLNFEAKNSYAIRVRTMDSAGNSLERTFTVVVTNVNEAPTNITLSNNTVSGFAATGTMVGDLSVVDEDLGDSHSLVLVDDAGGRFKIVGGQLQVADGTQLTPNTNFTVRVRATDQGGLLVEKDFTIVVEAANPNPVFHLVNFGPNITIRRSGDNVQVVEDASGSILLDQRIADTKSITVLGQNSVSERVTIDFNFGGSFDLENGVSFNAGIYGTDKVVFRGGVGDEVVSFTPTALGTGQLTTSFSFVEQVEILPGAGNDKVTIGGDATASRLGTPLEFTELFVRDESGDDIYSFTGRRITHTIDDDGGVDTFDFSQLGTRAQIYLYYNNGQRYTMGPSSNSQKLFGIIENVIGSPFDDLIYCNDADNLVHGGDGNDTIIGRGGNDILLGEAGNDVLAGETGRDLLFGGLGLDSILGGNDDDILIGGTTAHDNVDAALRALLAEWARTDLSFAQRQLNLQNGTGLTGGIALNGTTVFDDGVRDGLYGQGGLDWLFLGVNDFSFQD